MQLAYPAREPADPFFDPSAPGAFPVELLESGQAATALHSYAHSSSIQDVRWTPSPQLAGEGAAAAAAAVVADATEQAAGAAESTVDLATTAIQNQHYEGRLSSIDQYGRGQVSVVGSVPGAVPSASWSILPGPGLREDGWHALLPSPTTIGSSTVVSGPRREIRLYDAARCVTTVNTVHNPRAVCTVSCDAVESHSALVMVAEGSQFSVWDIHRTPQPVVRCSLSYGVLNTVASSSTYVATAGEDRAVNIISPKKWRLIGAWKSALKYSVGTIACSSVDDGALFAASRDDSEIACGWWTKGASKAGPGAPARGQYRGDARWTGFCRVGGTDNFFGLSAAGSVFYFGSLFAKSDAYTGGSALQFGAGSGGGGASDMQKKKKPKLIN